MFLVSAVAWGQAEVSCGLGYGNRGYSYAEKGLEAYDGSLPRGQECYVASRVGWWSEDVYCVGLRLSASFSDYGFVEGYYDPVAAGWQQSARREVSGLEVSGGAYVRFCLLRSGGVGLYAELSGSYGMGWGWDERTEFSAVDGSELAARRRTTQRGWCAQLLPVFDYALGSHVRVEASLNVVALTVGSRTTVCWPYLAAGGSGGDVPVSETTEQVFDVGVNRHNASVVTLGFTYRF